MTLLAVLCALIMCAESFAGGVDDIIPVSVDKEKNIGSAIDKQVEKEYGVVDDPLVQEHFENIGKRLAAQCDRQGILYHFKVLKPKEGEEKEMFYNAFALPGGYVYIFEPMMELMKTDDRIAAVTAHEIGHVDAKHAVKRLQSSLGINALLILAAATSRDGQTVAQANEAITQLMMAYSREDEFEADRLSVKYLKRAGFDPEGVTQSLVTLRKLRKEGREMRYMFYRTHPYLSQRIAATQSEIKGYSDFDSYINLPREKDDF